MLKNTIAVQKIKETVMIVIGFKCKKDLYYKTYLRTRDMYCDSGFANDYRVKCYLMIQNVLQNLRCPRIRL